MSSEQVNPEIVENGNPIAEKPDNGKIGGRKGS